MKEKSVLQESKTQPLSGRVDISSQTVIVRLEGSRRWVRGVLEEETIVNSKKVMILWLKDRKIPIYSFPKEDVRMGRLKPSDRSIQTDQAGEVTYWDIEMDDSILERAAWEFTNPPKEWDILKGHIQFEWKAMNKWFEEEEEVYVHLRDPYHRVDVLSSSRHVKVIIGGEVVADSKQPRLLFETGFPTRYYIPKEDVRMDLLEASELNTQCPYKGLASYWTAKVSDRVFENIVWGYPDPVAECPKIKDLYCFFNEKVDIIYVDDELDPKPITQWS